jgi:hypothetical protein
MRQRRKNIILQPIKWLLLVMIVGAGSIAGMSALGLIQLNSDKMLENVMFWKTKETDGKELSAEAAAIKRTEQAATPALTTASGSPSPAPSSAPLAVAAVSNSSPAPIQTAPAPGVQLLAQAQSTVPVNANERAWLDLVGLIKLEPGKLFSYNTWFAEQKAKTPEKKESELSHIAGMLYEAAIRSGMKVGERHAHLDIPSYASAGFDVEYLPDKKDLTFYNSLGFAVSVGVIYYGESPALMFNGIPSPAWMAPKITVNKEAFTPERMLLTDFTLIGRGEVVRNEGVPGLLVKVYSDAKNDGKSELLYKDFYAPRPVIIARGPTAEELK